VLSLSFSSREKLFEPIKKRNPNDTFCFFKARRSEKLPISQLYINYQQKQTKKLYKIQNKILERKENNNKKTKNKYL
jgi:hypothetical protein